MILRPPFFMKKASKDLLKQIKKWTGHRKKKKLSRYRDLFRHISSLTRPKPLPPRYLFDGAGDIVLDCIFQNKKNKRFQRCCKTPEEMDVVPTEKGRLKN